MSVAQSILRQAPKIVRAAKSNVDRRLYGVLDMVGSTLIRINRHVANAYTKRWSAFGITWFDHRFDHLRGPQNWYWCERGIFGNRIIQPGTVVLDLCCGDGVYSGLFYGVNAGSVDAVDRDERAIAVAKAKYVRENVKFVVADVVSEAFPRDNYDVICWFAAIEHFSIDDGTHLLQRIAHALSSKQGTLVGSTPIVLYSEKGKGNPEHDNEFFSVEQLSLFLQPHFSDVELWCSNWPGERKECYFVCKNPIVLTKVELVTAAP